MTSDEVTLKFLLTVYPEVKLGDYKAVEYKESRVTVTKKWLKKKLPDCNKIILLKF